MKSLRWVFLLSALITVVSIGGGVLAMALEIDWSRIGEMGFSELMENGIGPIVVMLFAMAVVLYMLYRFYRTLYPAKIKNGVAAEAKILKVWDTGTTINDNPQVGLLLEVRPPVGPVFQSESKTLVSRLNVALVQPGTAAKVIYDPENTKRIQVEEIQVEEPREENPPPSGAVERMEELERLRERRLITEAEYQEKRKQILDNL